MEVDEAQIGNPRGIDMYLTTAGTVFEFNTVADNSMTGVSCVANAGQFAFPNNLIAGNGNNIDPQPPGCVFSSSMILAGDVAPVKFKSRSSMPYDYHLTPGSIAIDQISTSTQVRDFDGEVRPYGNGHDCGADELH